MGACASCLGRRRSDSIDEEDSRLLFEDGNNMQYGSFGDHNLNSQADPLESQREAEALQRVVARTSNNLVDVFEITPQESQRPHPAIFAGQDARLSRYQNILSRLSTGDEATGGNVEWLVSEDDDGDQHDQPVTIKETSKEPLVGTFADAAAAVA
ncbi:late endosomal/lysosomal adaptor and MAPK and MTOR activator-domain-containing protein [Xylariaceae sp. FL1272]|nr:late endosomal/lysosomal adaptor and MAPK and MTOR activator-domain-containing protein [Xylariaceae sp. FL1272]